MIEFNSKEEMINAKADRMVSCIMEDGEGVEKKVREIEMQAASNQVRWMNAYDAAAMKRGAKGGYMIQGFGFVAI